MKGSQLFLTFRHHGRGFQLDAQDSAVGKGAKIPGCKAVKMIRATGGIILVLIQFDRPMIKIDTDAAISAYETGKSPKGGYYFCEREVHLLEVVLGKGAPIIRYKKLPR